MFLIRCALLSSAVVYSMYQYSCVDHLTMADIKSVASVVAQISATMAGFVLASLAVIASVSNSKLIRNMQKSGHFKLLLRRMLICIAFLGILVIMGIVIMLMPKMNNIVNCSTVWVCIFSMQMLLDVTWKFWVVLHNLHPEPTST